MNYEQGMFEESQSSGPSSRGLSIDFKRVLGRALSLWYLIVLSTLIGLTVAFLINRYTTRIYPVTTSIIIREPGENTDAGFLYNNPLVNAYRNYFNEPYIIRSYPLIQGVVEELQLQVSFQQKGNFKNTEQYRLPVRVELFNQKSGTVHLRFNSANTCQCFEANGVEMEFALGDTVECSGLRFRLLQDGNIDNVIGDEYEIVVNDPQQVAGRYINALRVSWAEQGSSVVNLDIHGAVAQKEIDFLDALIRHYQHYDLEKKSQAASRSLTFIQGQVEQIGDSLRLYENAMERFKQTNFVTDLSAESQQLFEQLKTLNDQKTHVVFANNYYDYLNEYLKKPNDYAQVIFPSSLGISDGVLNNLVTKLVELQTQFNLLPPTREEQNPLVKGKANRLLEGMREVKGQLGEALVNLRKTDRIKSNGIEQQISRVESKLRSLPVTERRLINIQRNYTFNETMYNFLQQKKAEAEITRASTTSDIVVVNPPRQNGGAITPKISQNYALFGFSGFLLPFVFFILIEVLNRKVQSREDVEKMTNIPFLGGIGHKSTSSNLVVHEKPKSAMAESFRSLRSNLNYFTQGKDRKIFMVTSSLSGEGKSFTSINLATVLALSGKRTLIIGADLRKPKIFSDFNLSNAKGLSTYLSGMATLDEVVQHTPVENLDLIDGGPVPPNPSELILGRLMDDLIKEVMQKYDYVLLDTPPMALITDGLVLGKYADHTLYIIRQNYTPKDLLKFVHELYTSGKMQNISLVLNDITKTGPGYGYGYGYTYGYGYNYDEYGGKKKGEESYYTD